MSDRRCMTCPVDAESRLPVGSSASKSDGFAATARRSRRAAPGHPISRGSSCREWMAMPRSPRELLCASARFFRRPPVEREGEDDVLLDRERMDQVEILEHETHLPASEFREFLISQSVRIDPVDPHRAARRLVNGRNHVEQRAFSAARRAHYPHELAFGDIEAYILQRGVRRSALVRLPKGGNLQHVHLRLLSFKELRTACYPEAKGL